MVAGARAFGAPAADGLGEGGGDGAVVDDAEVEAALATDCSALALVAADPQPAIRIISAPSTALLTMHQGLIARVTALWRRATIQAALGVAVDLGCYTKLGRRRA
jgi:hypothetical protein